MSFLGVLDVILSFSISDSMSSSGTGCRDFFSSGSLNFLIIGIFSVSRPFSRTPAVVGIANWGLGESCAVGGSLPRSFSLPAYEDFVPDREGMTVDLRGFRF